MTNRHIMYIIGTQSERGEGLFTRRKLKERRRTLCLTQAEVAQRAKIERSFYTRIENGKKHCSTETWKKIAEALNYPLDKIGDLIYAEDG